MWENLCRWLSLSRGSLSLLVFLLSSKGQWRGGHGNWEEEGESERWGCGEKVMTWWWGRGKGRKKALFWLHLVVRNKLHWLFCYFFSFKNVNHRKTLFFLTLLNDLMRRAMNCRANWSTSPSQWRDLEVLSLLSPLIPLDCSLRYYLYLHVVIFMSNKLLFLTEKFGIMDLSGEMFLWWVSGLSLRERIAQRTAAAPHQKEQAD